MRVRFVLANAVLLIASLGASGQDKQDRNVKIICPRVRTKLVKMVRPIYPKQAKDAGIEGKVSLRCIIGRDGSVETIEVTKGEGPFVEAAKTAVSQWKYKPLVLNGVAVKIDTTVDVVFKLPKKSNGSQGTNPPNS